MVLCPRGTFCVAGSTEPAVCQAGTLCNTLGGSAAGVCPSGSFCVAGEAKICPFHSTSKEGSDSIDDCVCESGLSLFANVSCEVSVVVVVVPVAEKTADGGGGFPWSAGVIAGVVVGSVVVVTAAVGLLVVMCNNNNGYSPV
jgi:hypothetical protein